MAVHAIRGRARFSWLTPATILLLLAVTAFSAGCDLEEEPDAGREPEAGLEVVLATPEGERQELYSIDVTFSEPMVRMGERGSRGGRGPIRIEPKLSGSFTWLGTQTVSFILDSPPPPGTRIVCTLPEGLKALSGRQLESDHTWSILYRPARLFASIPKIQPERKNQRLLQAYRRDWSAQRGRTHHLPDDPILLAFDRPVAGKALDGVAVLHRDGPVALHSVPVLREHLRALRRQNRRVDSLNVLALRPGSPFRRGEYYRIVLTPSLEFESGKVGLTDSLVIPFRIPGPPGIRSASVFDGGIRFSLESPVDPDSFLTFLEIEPRPDRLTARAWSDYGDYDVSVFGRFPPGQEVDLMVHAGLPDLTGLTTERTFTAKVRSPHADAVLMTEPAGGVIIPGPEEYLRLTARNAGPVRIRWVWITADEVPLYERAGQWGGPARISREGFRKGQEPAEGADSSIPWESRWQTEPDWVDASLHLDSFFRWERHFDRFEPRPEDAHLLLFEATARRAVEKSSSWQPDTLLVSTSIQTTTLGISSRQGLDKSLIWVTDLVSGSPVPDAEVTLWNIPLINDDPPGEPAWSGTTDADGIAWTIGASELPGPGFLRMARAESQGKVAWLRLSEHYADADTDREIPNTAFLHTDRPIYRPGETIHWKGIVRHSDSTGLTPVSASGLSVVLRSGRHPEIRLPVRETPGGNPFGEIELPEQIPTGPYSLALEVPGEGGQDGQDRREARTLPGTWVLIEAFRPPRFQAQVSTETPLVVSGGEARVTGRFAYFSGPPLSGQPVVWHVSREESPWSPPGWDRFRFREDLAGRMWEPRASTGSSPTLSGEARLDVEGRFHLVLPLVLPPEAGDSEVRMEIGARDLADQSAHARTTVRLVRGPHRPGVHSAIPDPDTEGEGVWEWIVVDTEGKPVEGLPVAMELFRRDWKTARIQRVGGTFDYETSLKDTLLATVHGVSGIEPQRQAFSVSEPGYFFLRVSVQQPDGSTLSTAAGRRLRGSRPFQAFKRGVTHLSVELDRESAGPGDTVHAVFSAPPGGAEGLILLESGGVLSASRVSLTGTPSVPVPLLNTAPPDASIAVLLAGSGGAAVSPQRGPRRDHPYFAHGSGTLRISTDGWRAMVEVHPDREVADPGGEIEIEVRLTSPEGEPLSGEVALAVVDESVLALTMDQVSDPLAMLFKHRGSGTVYDDTRFRLQLSPPREKGEGSPGGGGDEDPRGMPFTRSDFNPTAYWNPAIPVGSDGTTRVRVRLPDTLTRYRIRATAVCEGDRHGVGEAVFRTDQPIVVEPAAPRFVRLGDEWILGAVVENHTDQDMRIEVLCELEGAELHGRNRWKGNVRAGRTARADFRIRSTQEGEVSFVLQADAGSAVQGDRVHGSLICFDPMETIPEITFGRAYPVAEEVLALDDDLLSAAGEMEVRISASLLSGLSEPIDYLVEYPHPCLEQRCSRLLALLARRDLADRMPAGGRDPAVLDSLMQAGIAELLSHSRRGSLSLWPESYGGVDPYLAGYVLYTLSRLRKGGVDVPDAFHKNVWEIVKSRLEAAVGSPDLLAPDTEAFLTYAMSAAPPGGGITAEQVRKAVTDIHLERLDARRGRMSAAGRICLVFAMGELGRQQPESRGVSPRRMEFIFDEAAQGIDRTARLASISAGESTWPWRSSKEDRLRTTSLGVLFLSENFPMHPLLPSMLNWLLEQRQRGRWRNTHENAWALEAIRSYVERAEDLILPIQGRLTPGVSASRGFRFTREDLSPVSMRFTTEELAAFRRLDPGSRELPLRIESVGQNALYYDMRLERRYRALEGQPLEEGLIVFRQYVKAETGRPTERLDRGEPLLVHLAVVVPWDAEYLILEDHLPAGVEALNIRLLTTSRLQARSPAEPGSASAQDAWGRRATRREPTGPDAARDMLPVTYRDLRDDRVILYADDVPAGVYHIYYPVTATTPGVYTVPGARAELMYSPEIFGSSGAARIEVR